MHAECLLGLWWQQNEDLPIIPPLIIHSIIKSFIMKKQHMSTHWFISWLIHTSLIVSLPHCCVYRCVSSIKDKCPMLHRDYFPRLWLCFSKGQKHKNDFLSPCSSKLPWTVFTSLTKSNYNITLCTLMPKSLVTATTTETGISKVILIIWILSEHIFTLWSVSVQCPLTNFYWALNYNMDSLRALGVYDIIISHQV